MITRIDVSAQMSISNHDLNRFDFNDLNHFDLNRV